MTTMTTMRMLTQFVCGDNHAKCSLNKNTMFPSDIRCGDDGYDGQPAQPLGHDVLELHLAVPQVQLNLWHLKHKIGNIFVLLTIPPNNVIVSSPQADQGQEGQAQERQPCICLPCSPQS